MKKSTFACFVYTRRKFCIINYCGVTVTIKEIKSLNIVAIIREKHNKNISFIIRGYLL